MVKAHPSDGGDFISARGVLLCKAPATVCFVCGESIFTAEDHGLYTFETGKEFTPFAPLTRVVHVIYSVRRLNRAISTV